MGLFRLGLFDYRRYEHGAKISDDKEGIFHPKTFIKEERWDSNPPELEKFIKIERGNIKVKNIQISSTERSSNFYLYCVSDGFNKKLYEDLMLICV